MDSLRVRAYNVRFGDAILISVPDRENGTPTVRHILIDVGNVLIGSGGQDDVFEPVIEDIAEVLDGRPLDLYVMTHEHMDHVQGLLWAKEERGLEIKATHAWLTASAEPSYYERHPDARRKRLESLQTYQQVAQHLSAAGTETSSVAEALMLNNNPRKTADCVEYLRTVGESTTYVFRGVPLSGSHPFEEVTFEIWGPEEDTSTYYGRFRPMGLGIVSTAEAVDPDNDDVETAIAKATDATETGVATRSSETTDVELPLPPSGVDAGAFYRLVNRRRKGIYDNLRQIDKAANNSSIVFTIHWRGWKLLFAGDAEERAWKEMNKRNLLTQIHFLKVGHHGSHNGTPGEDLLDKILPTTSVDARERRALVSTHEGTYNNVPDAHTLDDLGDRCTVIRIGEDSDPLFTDILFPDAS